MSTSGEKILISILVFLFGLAAVPAYSQNQEYKEHNVVTGDTLWDISSKEIADPFLWPKIWKENPEIRNPDRIYPGQKVRIPYSLIRKDAAESAPQGQMEKGLPTGTLQEATASLKELKKGGPAEEITPIEKTYLIDMDTLISSGYIAEAMDSKGEIIASPTDKTLLGNGDYVYITTVKKAANGDRFYIVRSLGKIKHPETGDSLGVLIDVVGVAEVIGEESGQTKVKIVKSFSEVHVGDQLNDYHEIERPFLIDKPGTPDLKGFVVAVKQGRILNTNRDIVFIDKGGNDGVEVGDLVRVISSGKYKIPNGILQVIDTRETTSTAMVIKCDKEVSYGDIIGSAAGL